ncbi:MAG: thiamine pyrophosphate-binding protein, partial [Candidatus Omnitrophota bacterium]|nr:thiamine pyrophosphate-binding protein [Candidatus Omnitrophota bacterium]
MTTKMTGAQILIESLKKEGVEAIFGFPGGSVLPLFDALYN